VDYEWELIPVDENLAEPDEAIQNFIDTFKEDVDRKYNTMICKLARKLTHPKREVETSLGNLVADAFAHSAECDVMLVGSGSIRVEEMGPAVTLKDLMTCFPYDDVLSRYGITGKELRRIFAHIMRTENRNSEGECYQVNSKVRAVYNDSTGELESLKVDGKEVKDEENYTIAMQRYHFKSSTEYLNITPEELIASGKDKTVATSAQQVLEEYLRNNQNVKKEVEGRLVYKS